LTLLLQTLSSFSAGGPGKGMYNRVYRQVLNQYGWAESAFTAFHSESGLWGISGSTLPHHARDMVQVFTEHLARLAVEPVSDAELDRARNMLKCNVLTQLESRLVLFEDMGRQVLTYGQRECMNVTCEKIAAVTKEDVREVALKALQQPPTVASVGDNLNHVPRHEEVVQWLS
jgi:processing peptidase subunit alpha